VVGADVIDATRWAFFKRRLFSGSYFNGLFGIEPGAGLFCAFERTKKVLS
jgi:hypothetical protein